MYKNSLHKDLLTGLYIIKTVDKKITDKAF